MPTPPLGRTRALDVNASIRELSALLASLSGSTVSLRYELEDALPAIDLDLGSFEQVLVNLFLNAKQALAGNREIVIRSRAIARQGAARIAVELEDVGRGVKEQGKGLGLTIVRAIAEQAGGSVEVEGLDERGALVRVLLPPSPRSSASPGGHGPFVRSGWREAHTVLVVDDEPAVRRVISAALKRRGYQVLEASDGHLAVEQFMSDPTAIDLVICDVLLPGESGVDVVETMIKRRPELKAMFVTGFSLDDLDRSGVSLGRHPFIEKPFSVEDLTRAVDRVWGATDAMA